MADEMLARLLGKQEDSRKERDVIRDKRAAIMQVATDEGREDLTDTETTEFEEFSTELKRVDLDLATRDARIVELTEENKRSDNAQKAIQRASLASSRISVREGVTYPNHDGPSYLRDLVLSQVNRDAAATERLERHSIDVATNVEYRDITRTDTAGGFFVPPVWLMADYAALARAGRPTANLCNNQPLPPGTDSINIPRITTGTSTAIQTADNAAVSETDIVDASVAAGVKTVAGQEDVAIQLLEQSPINFDQVIFADLIADLATKVDVQVLSGSNASGQVQGIRGTTGINAVTYTDASATVGELYPKVADSIQQIHTGRFMAPTVIVMHPRRWAWMTAALDSTNRPLVVPTGQGPTNAIASFAGVFAEQVVGSLQGLPVVTDASIPTTLGAGTNEDTILVMRASDNLLWESGIKTRVLPDVGSGTLTVRLQVYSYIAFTAGRYPEANSAITGTGLTAPSF